MKSLSAFKLLIGGNVVLLACLLFGLTRKPAASSVASDNQASALESASGAPASSSETNVTGKGQIASASSYTPATPFGKIYSADPKTFASNLKAIGCPDQTVADILTAEMHRRFQAQEEALRPKPADHVPYTWSAKITEPRLLERREEAAGLAREQGALLRNALGCESTVSMPLYAMTVSDVKFEQRLSATPSLDTCTVRQVRDDYWAKAQALQQRTKGFWLPEDVAELEQLKAAHKQALASFFPDQ